MPDSSNAVIQRHGVMVRWQNHGLLLCGPPGIGKSSLALAILSAGGQLIADDCVDIINRNQQLIAQCPPETRGLLHHRELGLLDIPVVFNASTVIDEAPIDAIIELLQFPPKQLEFSPKIEHDILGKNVPVLTLSVVNPQSLIERIDLWLEQQQLISNNQSQPASRTSAAKTKV